MRNAHAAGQVVTPYRQLVRRHGGRRTLISFHPAPPAQRKTQRANPRIKFYNPRPRFEQRQTTKHRIDNCRLPRNTGLQKRPRLRFHRNAGKRYNRWGEHRHQLRLGLAFGDAYAQRPMRPGESNHFVPVRPGRFRIHAEQNIRPIIQPVDDDRPGAAEGFQAAQQNPQRDQQRKNAGVH